MSLGKLKARGGVSHAPDALIDDDAVHSVYVVGCSRLKVKIPDKTMGEYDALGDLVGAPETLCLPTYISDQYSSR